MREQSPCGLAEVWVCKLPAPGFQMGAVMLQHLKLGRRQLQQLCRSQPHAVTLLWVPILANHLQSWDRL